MAANTQGGEAGSSTRLASNRVLTSQVSARTSADSRRILRYSQAKWNPPRAHITLT